MCIRRRLEFRLTQEREKVVPCISCAIFILVTGASVFDPRSRARAIAHANYCRSLSPRVSSHEHYVRSQRRHLHTLLSFVSDDADLSNLIGNVLYEVIANLGRTSWHIQCRGLCSLLKRRRSPPGDKVWKLHLPRRRSEFPRMGVSNSLACQDGRYRSRQVRRRYE